MLPNWTESTGKHKDAGVSYKRVNTGRNPAKKTKSGQRSKSIDLHFIDLQWLHIDLMLNWTSLSCEASSGDIWGKLLFWVVIRLKQTNLDEDPVHHIDVPNKPLETTVFLLLYIFPFINKCFAEGKIMTWAHQSNSYYS